jgi:hypothetical protein
VLCQKVDGGGQGKRTLSTLLSRKESSLALRLRWKDHVGSGTGLQHRAAVPSERRDIVKAAGAWRREWALREERGGGGSRAHT